MRFNPVHIWRGILVGAELWWARMWWKIDVENWKHTAHIQFSPNSPDIVYRLRWQCSGWQTSPHRRMSTTSACKMRHIVLVANLPPWCPSSAPRNYVHVGWICSWRLTSNARFQCRRRRHVYLFCGKVDIWLVAGQAVCLTFIRQMFVSHHHKPTSDLFDILIMYAWIILCCRIWRLQNCPVVDFFSGDSLVTGQLTLSYKLQ